MGAIVPQITSPTINSASNHQSHDCLLYRLFRRRSKKTSKLCVTGLCAGNSPGTGEFPAQMASNAENVSIWWRHHYMETLSVILAQCKETPQPFVREIRRSPFDSPHKGPVTQAIIFSSVDVSLNIRLNKQSSYRWFETPWRSRDWLINSGFTGCCWFCLKCCCSMHWHWNIWKCRHFWAKFPSLAVKVTTSPKAHRFGNCVIKLSLITAWLTFEHFVYLIDRYGTLIPATF